MFKDINKVLILAPHPDDAEFGLGGTLVKLIEMGAEVHLALFSLCEKSTPAGFEPGIIEKEFHESSRYLGLKEENLHIFNYQVRDFPAFRQDILEDMIRMRREIKPDLIFLPSSSDIHQDHNTIYNEGIRAFKHFNLLGYEMPWNNFGFKSYVFVNLTKEQVGKKINALKIYKSQVNREYSSPEIIESLARIRAMQIGRQYAESFELIRFIQL
jgi:LmbE family N-acetylglucosaminyl deacetylase